METLKTFSFNTCISAFMIAINELRKLPRVTKETLENLVVLMAPFAPFLSEELWSLLGYKESVHHQSYPIHNEEFLIEDSVSYPICFNGKKRTMESFPSNFTKEEIEMATRKLEFLSKWTEGKDIKKIIVVPGRMVNVVF